jgi:hypothetical protein
MNCPRCGLKRSGSISFCPVCGFEFNDSAPTDGNEVPEGYTGNRRGPSSRQKRTPIFPLPNPSRVDRNSSGREPFPVPTSTQTQDVTGAQRFDFLRFLGWRNLNGIVIAIDPPYMTKPESTWPSLITKFTIGLILSPLIIGGIIIALVFSIFLSIFGFGRNRPGFFSSLASQVVGFFLTGKLFGPKEQVPVRDIRVRDEEGQEHLVRLRGELVAGNLNVGDEVEVEGFDRRGTLMFRRGRNKRTRAEILVKLK